MLQVDVLFNGPVRSRKKPYGKRAMRFMLEKTQHFLRSDSEEVYVHTLDRYEGKRSDFGKRERPVRPKAPGRPLYCLLDNDDEFKKNFKTLRSVKDEKDIITTRDTESTTKRTKKRSGGFLSIKKTAKASYYRSGIYLRNLRINRDVKAALLYQNRHNQLLVQVHEAAWRLLLGLWNNTLMPASELQVLKCVLLYQNRHNTFFVSLPESVFLQGEV